MVRVRGFGGNLGVAIGLLCMSKMGIFLIEKRWVNCPSLVLLHHSLNALFPFPPLLAAPYSKCVCAKENNEPVRGILVLLAICVYYVRYIERNGIYNSIMVLIVGHI